MVRIGVPDAIVKPGVYWTNDCTIIAIVTVPFLLAQVPPYYILWGLCLPIRPFSYANSPKQRSFRSLRVCLATKATNVQVGPLTVGVTCISRSRSQVTRPSSTPSTCGSHSGSPSASSSSRSSIPPVTPSSGSCPAGFEQLQVPVDFRAERATHKARVLERYRRQANLTDHDWVLHLDEETEIDEYLMKTCLDFIERGSDDVGMV